jgi:hypothetical protein
MTCFGRSAPIVLTCMPHDSLRVLVTTLAIRVPPRQSVALLSLTMAERQGREPASKKPLRHSAFLRLCIYRYSSGGQPGAQPLISRFVAAHR